MVGNGGLRYSQLIHQNAGALLPLPQKREDGQTLRIAKGFEYPGVLLVNRIHGRDLTSKFFDVISIHPAARFVNPCFTQNLYSTLQTPLSQYFRMMGTGLRYAAGGPPQGGEEKPARPEEKIEKFSGIMPMLFSGSVIQ